MMENRRRDNLIEEMGLSGRLEFYVVLAGLAVSVILLSYGIWM